MKVTRAVLCLITAGALILLLVEGTTARAEAAAALRLCSETVIPALFPFLVLSTLLISLGAGPLTAPALAPLMEGLFRLPGAAGTALVLGLAGGYPMGARTAAELHRSGNLTREEACRLLTFCNNANPAFFLGVLGDGVFHDAKIGLILWLIHVLSALLTGMLLSGRQGKPRRSSPPPLPAPRPFARLWVEAVGGGLQAMLSVCAFVVIFRVLTAPLAQLGGRASLLAVGLTELFSLIPRLSANRGGFLLSALCSGWGGVSVLCQTAAMLEGSGLPLTPCLRGKAVQAALSALLAAGVSVILGI